MVCFWKWLYFAWTNTWIKSLRDNFCVSGEYKDVWAVENKWNTEHQLKAHFYKVRQEMETNNQTIEDFLHEASIMRQFDHPNVLSIYGVSLHNDKPCVLLPLMPNGDLQKYLKDHNSVSQNKWVNTSCFCKISQVACNGTLMFCVPSDIVQSKSVWLCNGSGERNATSGWQEVCSLWFGCKKLHVCSKLSNLCVQHCVCCF